MRCFDHRPSPTVRRIVAILNPMRVTPWRICVGLAWALTCTTGAIGDDQRVRPFGRGRLTGEVAKTYSFDQGTEGWLAASDSSLAAANGSLVIQCGKRDPYVHAPALGQPISGPVLVRLRMKSSSGGAGEVFWRTREQPGWSSARSTGFRIGPENQWHEYEVRLAVAGSLVQLRLDPPQGPGRCQLERVDIEPLRYHPLEILQVRCEGDRIRIQLVNHFSKRIRASWLGQQFDLAAGAESEISATLPGDQAFGRQVLEIGMDGFPALRLPVSVIRTQEPSEWLTLESPELTLQIANDGSGGRILKGDQLLAWIAPLVHCDDVVPEFKVSRTKHQILLRSDHVTWEVRIEKNTLRFAIQSERPCEGPVIRPLGSLKQGVFAGIEYLGEGESSSSRHDIETAEHLRFVPNPLQVTMPLMAVRTELATLAMTWEDMSNQPVFACPNFLDGAPGHRMAFRGTHIRATLRVDSDSLEDAILWSVMKQGLPPLPDAPRSPQAQWQLCLDALNGPLRSDAGWGHCAEPKWGRRHGADFASTIYRMTGSLPKLPQLVPGAAHIRNEASYFLTGRTASWLRLRRAQAESLIQKQSEDGSFRYRGKYQRGHFEDTASGFCARSANQLLEFALYTGDMRARQAGLKTLDYMQRFRTPRGAQVWELSLHTPDILASAHLVSAYVRGYELSGKAEYLDRARSWAISGLPFVYLWSAHPTMAYATVPVFGATNWRAPNWIGLPVQWCGVNYAYALTQLAVHDASFDWNQLARGILLAGERMQYPDGPLVGCLPDVFYLPSQQRAGPSINPCALVSLRLALDGQVDHLALARDASHRVLAPFPTRIENGNALVEAPRGTNYQVLVDGSRIVDIQSQGLDVIALVPQP